MKKEKKRYIALAIDNFSRWPLAIVCKSCNKDSALKLLAVICENIGLPKCLKVDNATAFKSRKFRNFLQEKGIEIEFSTPYVHTPIGIVERHITTLESYIKPFLLENNDLKHAVRRAIKGLRFTENSVLGMSPFKKLTGNKPRNVICNRIGLENPDATIVTMVKNPLEQPLGTQKLDALDLAEYESARTWGRSRNVTELRRFINEQTKPKKRKVRKFVVETKRNRKGWESKFSQKPKLISSETKPTVKIGKRILHKKDVAEVRKK